MVKHKYIKDVTTLSLAADQCVGCGLCTVVCPHDVFAIDGKKARIKDKDSCMECGACAKNCPSNAITVDAGVGCAAAIITGWITGSEPSCDCSRGGGKCC